MSRHEGTGKVFSKIPHKTKGGRFGGLCHWQNFGVDCHLLLQCMKVKSESEVAQSCPTLSDPMDCSLPGSSVHGIFQARVLECGAIAFSVETYITICKIDSNENLLYGSGNSNRSSVST